MSKSFPMQAPRSPPSGFEMPSDIAEMIKVLDSVENVISTLRAELRAAEHRRDIIWTKLEPFGITRRGIQGMPVEVLCDIFSLVDEQQAVRNCNLALVCKGWHILVDGTPQLWTEIVIKWPGDLKRILRSWKYLQKCLDKSKQSLLDVTIDFRDMPKYEDYINTMTNDYTFKVDIDPYKLLYKPFTGYEIQPLESHRLHYSAVIPNTMRLLNDKGHRMRSLHLVVPHYFKDSLSNTILNELGEGEDSVNLVALRFDRAAHSSSHGTLPVQLPPLQGLRRLKTDEPVLFAQHPSMATLESLHLGSHTAAVEFLFRASSAYSALKILLIYIINLDELNSRGWASQNSVLFQSLRKLTIKSYTTHEIMPFFNTPQLQTLQIEIYDAECPNLPIFSTLKELTLNCEWAPHEDSTWPTLPLRSALIQSPCLRLLTVRVPRVRHCARISDIVTTVIEEVRANGVPLPLLTSFIIVDSEAIPTRMYQEVDVSVRDNDFI